MKQSNTKRAGFFRRNALFLILAFCILAVGLSLTLIFTVGSSVESNVEDVTPIDTPQDVVDIPEQPSTGVDDIIPSTPAEPVVTVISFIMPVNNATSIGEYSDTMVFNSTLKRFSAHKAVDFYAIEGADVLAVYGGTVESVTNQPLLTGVTIVIDHANGLKTYYNSVANDELVAVGQTVAQGQKIGSVSVTNKQERNDGAHLHFSVTENGETINPAKYLEFDEK